MWCAGGERALHSLSLAAVFPRRVAMFRVRIMTGIFVRIGAEVRGSVKFLTGRSRITGEGAAPVYGILWQFFSSTRAKSRLPNRGTSLASSPRGVIVISFGVIAMRFCCRETKGFLLKSGRCATATCGNAELLEQIAVPLPSGLTSTILERVQSSANERVSVRKK